MSEERENYFNTALNPLLYELSIANAPFPPEDCRDLADKIGARIGGAKNRIQTILGKLEAVDTTKLAAQGLYDEATAIGEARVLIDRLIGFSAAPPLTQGAEE